MSADIEVFKRLKKRLGRKPKVALYLRRSAGEGGSTAEQLEQALAFIEPLEKAGVIRKLDKRIKGRDPTKKEWRGVDLDRPGDIHNEGEGASGFNPSVNRVLMGLLDDLREDEYDAAVAVSVDRFARNYGALSRYAYDLWGETDNPRLFYGFAEKLGLGDTGQQGIINEKVLASLMEWGGLAKTLEIAKAEGKRTGTNVDKGYLLGSRPEWLGFTYRGKTSKGTPYRAAWEAIQAGKSGGGIARAARKFAKDGSAQASWTRTWRPRLEQYDQLGVLDAWLDAVEAVNQYIRDMGGYPKNAFKSREVSNILRSTAGYFAYPAGVLLLSEGNIAEFVTFPYPLDIGLDVLAQDGNIWRENFTVARRQYDGRPLLKVQTQPRAGQGRDGQKKTQR
jgi:hypothetical protein